MIIVTGGAGFIGSNIVKALNQKGRRDILVVDDLTQGKKYERLVDLEIQDYWDREAFLHAIQTRASFLKKTEVIFHQGACSNTTEWDGRWMMDNNYTYSKAILHYCLEAEISLIYASSAAVYGNSSQFQEEGQGEKPLNVYGYSKSLFDHYVRQHLSFARAPLVGLRYFNIYGPGEDHKGTMASIVYHWHHQLLESGKVRLFRGSGGCQDGEQRRDFIYVSDVVAVNLWFLENPEASGIYNVGTGRSASFNDVARAVIDWHGFGEIEYIPFPEHLKDYYQHVTQADLTLLRKAGFQAPFLGVREGVKEYLERLSSSQRAFSLQTKENDAFVV